MERKFSFSRFILLVIFIVHYLENSIEVLAINIYKKQHNVIYFIPNLYFMYVFPFYY